MRSVLLAAALVACAHSPEYRGQVSVVSSELIPLDPDVRVVADASKPMFFAAGSYWLFHDAGWYRGRTVQGPWVLEKKPPWQVRKIDQPYAYTRYRLDHPRDQTATAKEETASPDLAAPRKNRMFRF
jgi:hypothetical protein